MEKIGIIGSGTWGTAIAVLLRNNGHEVTLWSAIPAEIARLGIAMGGKYQTYTGLSGIGDLIVTCASMHSRNRRAGILIGKGYTMEEAMKEVQMVVEGVYSAKAARSLAKKYNVSMPIVEEVNQVLFEGKPAKEAVADLMLRDKRIEHSDLPWE